ncbi:unnamed protein product [Closterium sp. NIES-54]
MGFAGVAVVVAAGRPSQSSACDESQTASHGAIRALPRNVPLPRERESLGAAEQGAPPPGGAVALARSCCSRIGGNNLPRGMLPACAYFDMVGADGAVCAVGARGVSLVPAWEGRGGASSGERGTLALFQGHEYREEYQESSCRQQGNASSGKSKHPSQLLLRSPSGFFLGALCFCFSPNSLSHPAVFLCYLASTVVRVPRPHSTPLHPSVSPVSLRILFSFLSLEPFPRDLVCGGGGEVLDAGDCDSVGAVLLSRMALSSITVITGRGKHSASGQAKIKPAERGVGWQEQNAGSIQITRYNLPPVPIIYPDSTPTHAHSDRRELSQSDQKHPHYPLQLCLKIDSRDDHLCRSMHTALWLILDGR